MVASGTGQAGGDMDTDTLWECGTTRLRRCREGVLMYNINDRFIGQALDRYGEISRGEAALFAQLVRPGMIAVEAGANIGILTVPLARLVGPGGGVVAFEPQRMVHQMLCGNLALNAISNVTVYQAAVGSQPGSINVPPVDYAAVGNFGGVSLGGAAGETVPLHIIDELYLQRCEFIKIDVEGMECEVLQGAAQTMRRFRPRLYVENDRVDKSPDLIEHLFSLDYRLYWHLPPLFEPDNYFGNPENVFGNIVSVNMVCLPRSGPLSMVAHGLCEITSPAANWRSLG
jgi:FkbM family methyltransferase